MYAAQSTKPIRYPWWKRLWRIYRFLRRQKRKRKQQKKNLKQQKKHEQKKQTEAWKWRKKVKRRARRMAIKRYFRPKRITRTQYEEQLRLKAIKQKAKRRKRRIFYKSLVSARPTNPTIIAKREAQKKKQIFETYKRRRLRRFVLKKHRQIIWNILRGKGLPKKAQHKKRPNIWLQALGKEKLIIMFNSLTTFLLSYYFVMIASKIGTAVAALFFDIKAVIYNNTISYIVEEGGWTMDAIKTVFAAGPVIALLIAVVCVLLYSQIYAERGVLKLLILWAIFHGFNQIIMGILAGSFTGQGIGYVISYSYFMDTDKLIISIVMISLALAIGLISIRVWVNTANSYYTATLSHDRKQFIIAQVFLPYLLGNGIILLVTLPHFIFFDTIINFSLLIFLIPTLLRGHLQPDTFFETEEEITVRWRYRIFIFAVLFIASVRYSLHIGIRFT